jgi:hypothetical protein
LASSKIDWAAASSAGMLALIGSTFGTEIVTST